MNNTDIENELRVMAAFHGDSKTLLAAADRHSDGTLWRLEESRGRNKAAAGELTPRRVPPPVVGAIAEIRGDDVFWTMPNDQGQTQQPAAEGLAAPLGSTVCMNTAPENNPLRDLNNARNLPRVDIQPIGHVSRNNGIKGPGFREWYEPVYADSVTLLAEQYTKCPESFRAGYLACASQLWEVITGEWETKEAFIERVRHILSNTEISRREAGEDTK